MATLKYVTCPLLTGVSLLTGCHYLRTAPKQAFGNRVDTAKGTSGVCWATLETRGGAWERTIKSAKCGE